jgi:alkylation response protein AidB-like acyl-CoA dehydrogenase
MAATRDSEEIAGIRQAVRALCAGFPGEYWRTLDRDRAYPTEFVDALTKGGFLAALIPEEYGGSGLTMSSAIAIMEEIQAAGCNGAACHAQMYTMGNRLSASPSRRPAPIRWRCAPPRCATATTATSSTGRRSGPRARNIPT